LLWRRQRNTGTFGGRGAPLYFDDLSPYQYGRAALDAGIVNIGWLSRDHAYETGKVPSEFVAALRALVAAPVNLYRGLHLCEFCPAPPIVTTPKGLQLIEPRPGTAGNGEIRVVGSDGITHVAPVMVLHYIEVHGYRPPDAFIAAVLQLARTEVTPRGT
jgi:hypothetical protein